MNTPWPWWAGALALATIAVVHEVTLGRSLAVSGQLGRALEKGGGRGDALLFLGALAGGGLISAIADGALTLHTLSASAVRFFGGGLGPFAALLVGGVLVGFGTSLAGGCTSGHGLVGCARARPSSLVVTATFFGTGIAVALALSAVRP